MYLQLEEKYSIYWILNRLNISITKENYVFVIKQFYHIKLVLIFYHHYVPLRVLCNPQHIIS